jgi:SAM-dependent methyltransferase
MSYPERIVPDETERGIVAIHRKRYEFALPFCVGKEVLDAGCGVGYGSALLAERAQRVVGVDVDEEAIAYARARYGAPNVEFLRLDLLEPDLPSASFDVVCAFETLEHLTEPEAFLAQTARLLRPDGVLLLSTPRAERTTLTPENPFHSVEFAPADLERLLRARFGEAEIYGQRRLQTARHRLAQRLDVLGLRKRLPVLRPASRLLGTAPTAELTSADLVISTEGIEHASELVAVCRAPRSVDL